MQGHFDLTMLNTPGLTRDLIEAVRREGGDPAVEDYLRKFAKEGEWKTDNLIYQIVPGALYTKAFSGPGQWNSVSTSFADLCACILTTTASEPSYNGELYSADYISWEDVQDTAGIGTGKGKRFINDCIVTPDFKIDPNGREAVYGKFKWLYLPGEATSSVIRSISIYGAGGNPPWTGQYKCVRHGRVRIKDSGGNPVTISKISTRSLLVEYTFTMPTL